MRFTRRHLGRLALASLPAIRAHASIDSTFGGVRLGVNTYSFRGMPFDEIIRQVAAASIGFMEVESPYIEPVVPPAPGGGRGMSPEQRQTVRKWRLSLPLADFRAARKKLDDAGIVPYAYNIGINDSFTDDEIHAVFQMAQALGVQALVTASTMPVAQRLPPFAEHYKLRVGLHPSGNATAPGAVASGDSYRAAVALSPFFGPTLDCGRFQEWGPDPLAFIAEMHARIVTLHAHDRKIATNTYVPFGEGDVPIKDILLLMKREHYTFVPMIERIYALNGSDTLTEIRRSFAYFKQVLA